MKLFRNKTFLWVVLLSVSFYLLSAPTARAGFFSDLFGSFLGTFLMAAIVVVAVVTQQYWVPMVMVETFGGAVLGSGLAGTVFISTAAFGTMTILSVGGVLTGIVACAEGLICPGGQTSGLYVAPISAQGVECTYQIPATFYNPQMNVSYGYSDFLYTLESCEWDDRLMTFECPIPNISIGASPRYRDSACADLLSDPFSLETKYAKVSNVGCVPVIPSGDLQLNPYFNETNRQVAIYRYTLPADSGEAALNNWFLYTIKANVGNGWQSDSYIYGGVYGSGSPQNGDYGYLTSSEATPLIIAPYANLCAGNVCKFTDATAPENSYIAYVAKVLGSYSYWYTSSPDISLTVTGFDYPYYSFLVTRDNKFFNTDNASYSWFPIADQAVPVQGNAIAGPFLTGHCPEPSPSVAASPAPSATPSAYTLSVSKTGNGASDGHIISSPAGIDCKNSGDPCDASFAAGSQVTLTNSGGNFSGWSGACSGSGDCAVIMDAAKSVTATFNLPLVNGVCGSASGASFDIAPASNLCNAGNPSNVSGSGPWTWTCAGLNGGTTASCSANIKIYAFNVTKSGSGTIISSPAGIDCGATCSASYNYGTPTVLTATPATGYIFDNWSGCDSVSGNTCSVTVNAAKSVSASFVAKTLNVSLAVAPSSGSRPLSSTLSATVGGTAVGTVNYTFYCNRSDNGTNITAGWDGKYDGQAATTKTHICTYSSIGTFSPKVIVERDSSVPNATEKKTITVVNQAPSASGGGGSGALTVSQPNYCASGPAATFGWTFFDPDSGDTQSAYQVQVATNPGFSGPGLVVDTGKVSSASNSYAVTQGIMSYGTAYYWRVRVWDNHDTPSPWATGSSFTTPSHQYPTVNFSWAPAYPSAGEATQFADQSAVFGGATKQAWLWNIADAAYTGGTNSSSQNPQVKFSSIGSKSVSLTLTDSSGYGCSTAKTATVRLPLPGWKEVAP